PRALDATTTIPVPAPRSVPGVRVPAPGPVPVPTPVPGSAEARAPSVADTNIRVDVGLLDGLMTLVGELVLARNQIVRHTASAAGDPALLATVQRLNLLTTELQAGVMKTRMQPIGNVLGKFPRVVRDLAVACGKQVRLDIEGQDTELDRTIIEAIRDPLTHAVRNAVDHGIEAAAGRVAWGKPPEGRLHLRAFHESGKVVIEIADDGAGIDPNRVRDKALAAKLVTADRVAGMSARELVNLVFLPGFTTADRVTHFSGRGVGMDVVRTNIEKIGGTVDLESRPARGTTVRMKIPLTLAIIPALTITSGAERYAIPQVSVVELLHIDADRAGRAVESVHGAPVYRLRGSLLPLVSLARELGDCAERPAGAGLNVVVVQADDRQFGLIVDAIHDTEEIVVKPLQKLLKGVGAFAGATIMGDGKVALILDVLGLAQRAHVLTGTRARARAEAVPDTTPTEVREPALLFAAPGGGRMAVPLACVARLEEFPRSAVERVGRGFVVQYRGAILPLVDAGRARGARPKRPRDPNAPLQVVVCAHRGRRAGLVVGRVIDIVDEAVAARAPATRPGVAFTAVVRDRVTEFLDVDALLDAEGGAP
ncbi:MAG: histidine kinase, partial [Planctomycetes bacterium]|nr:histidine kinase [Planctomycetota bacterium]